MLKLADQSLFLDCSNDFVDAFAAGPIQLKRGKLRIVCSRSLRHPQLRAFSEDECPTLLVAILANEVTLGPLQMRQRSVCLACLQYWAAVAEWGTTDSSVSSLSGTKLVDLALRLTKEAIQRFERFGTIPELEHSLTMVDVGSGKSSHHPIFPRADCHACAGLRNQESMDLKVHCSPVTGIVKHLKCFSQPMAGVFQAFALFANPISVAGIPRSLGTAWGRGMSAGQAANACIGEALETYSVTYRGDEPMQRAALADLAKAIDPQAILLCSPDQYENREQRNRLLANRHAIPEPFDPAQPIDWVAGRDLTDDTSVWVPAACCLIGYQFPEGAQKFAVASRAGCASRIPYSDALAEALLELIEHDAVAIWWYNQLQRPAIQLESLGSPSLLLIRDALQRINRSLCLLDITTDIKIPTYVAVSAARGGTQLLFGAATHYSPRAAAEKAATELSQRWLCSHIAQLPSDFIAWGNQASLANQPYCKPVNQTAAPSEPTPLTTSAIAQLCVQRLRDIGIRPVAVDLSRPDVLLHTVRVIAPGMRSVHDRRAPGRLYEVPVQLGWLGTARTEAQLNANTCVC